MQKVFCANSLLCNYDFASFTIQLEFSQLDNCGHIKKEMDENNMFLSIFAILEFPVNLDFVVKLLHHV